MDHYESRLAALKALCNAAAEAEEQHFDNEIDKLGMVKIFGITGKRLPKRFEGDDVIAQAKVLQAGYKTTVETSLLRGTCCLISTNRVSIGFRKAITQRSYQRKDFKTEQWANGRKSYQAPASAKIHAKDK